MSNLEDLNKTQIILLTLLVSFITSMATGIITAALLAQAPEGVTQTINRVVEHTIERVASTATSTATTKEVVVVKEDDAILSSINRTESGVVRINVRGADGASMFYALGAIVTKDGLVVSDGQGLVLDGTYTATLSDGTQIPAAVYSRSADQNLAVFKLMSGDPKQTYAPISLSPSDPQLGQSIIAFEGKTDVGVAVGRVESLATNGTKSAASVATDLATRGETAGGPLIDLSGELVGIKSSSADMSLPTGIYTALAPIRAQLAVPRSQ